MLCSLKNKRLDRDCSIGSLVCCGSIKNAEGIGCDLFGDGINITYFVLFVKFVNL